MVIISLGWLNSGARESTGLAIGLSPIWRLQMMAIAVSGGIEPATLVSLMVVPNQRPSGTVAATVDVLLRPHADTSAHRLYQCLLQLIVLRAFLQGFIQFLASFIGCIVLINHFL
jgi:hypothetical protein